MFEVTEYGIRLVLNHRILLAEAWGQDALRIRDTARADFVTVPQALSEPVSHEFQAEISDSGARIRNGRLSCTVSPAGHMEFFRDGKLLLKEYARDRTGANGHSGQPYMPAREFQPLENGDYQIYARFEGQPEEKIYGMGQYQQSNLDLKGCVLELAQRNSQVSVPFCLSGCGYGFLWNCAAVGEVFFGANYTQWTARQADQLDYWITCGDTPARILENYTQATGRAPAFPEDAAGLWQCKLRYRSQQEILEVAREYRRRKLPLDVIVIDFFHWTAQGDWDFDPAEWPDPAAMTRELAEMGVRCAVSVWPTVDTRRSRNFREMEDRGYLVRGDPVLQNPLGESAVYYDAFNPEAGAFVWDQVKKHYFDRGIRLYWLDADEPEFMNHYFEHFSYCAGPAMKVSNAYPACHLENFYRAQRAAQQEPVVFLTRSAWAGSQKHGALVWSGDIKSNFTALQDQLAAGLNMGLAGIPWWTTDIGGFHGDGLDEDQFRELLIRWYQFMTFSPVLRMHGARSTDQDRPGVYAPNELWSYGEEALEIMKKYLEIRLSMKDYILELYARASRDGSPLLRTMFYEFPGDPRCWQWQEQYMFGPRYLVAPVVHPGVTRREVYLPQGQWKDFYTGKIYEGGCTVEAEAPLSIIPVFCRE